MGKKLVLSLTCLAPLMLAPVAVVGQTTPQPAAKPSPAKVQQSSAAKPGAPRSKAQPGAAQPKLARSKERIYAVTPSMLESLEDKQASRPSASRVEFASESEIPFLGFSPIDNSFVGVGLWRMRKASSLDPNRANPIRNTRRQAGKAAAVGMQINF